MRAFLFIGVGRSDKSGSVKFGCVRVCEYAPIFLFSTGNRDQQREDTK